MPKFLRITGIENITPPGLDGHRYRISFEIGEKKDDIFTPSKRYTVDVDASRTLQAVWDRSDAEMEVSSASSATSHLLTLASGNRLDELHPLLRLNTYTAPKYPPTAPVVQPGALLPVPEPKPTPEPRTFSLLSEDISELRDQVNAIAKDIWGDRIFLLSQERPLLDMYKSVRSVDEFRARVQSLGIIVKDVNKPILAKVAGVADPESTGEIVLLQKALETVLSDDKAEQICAVLKHVNNLRQGYPTHGDNAKRFLEAHRFFRLPYPVTDYEGAWEPVLGEYFRAMGSILEGMSEAWERRK